MGTAHGTAGCHEMRMDTGCAAGDEGDVACDEFHPKAATTMLTAATRAAVREVDCERLLSWTIISLPL